MSLDLVADIWEALRSHISLTERKYAADAMVDLLIDNNFELDEIKDAFRGEKEILTSLKDYVGEHGAEEYEEDFEEEDEDW